MTIPRLKTGGTLARVVNQIIDYLPRLRVQSTPQLQVDHTPRGQVIRYLQTNTVAGEPIVRIHPWQVVPQGGLSDQIDVYWGTVGGQEDFAENKKAFTVNGNSRVVVQWLLEVSASTANGVSGVTVSVESVDDPFSTITIEGEGIRYKALIALVNVVDGALVVTQTVNNHIPAIP
jgi:hypothetical protein